MKKIIFSAAILMAAFANAQNTGIGTTSPNATLDVKGSPDITTAPDGVIAPRLTRAQLIAKNGYGASQTGAIVYVSDTTGTTNAATANVNSIGYYFFDGTIWQKISGNDWSIIGNAGTTPGTNFIGTTDDKSLIFKVNNAMVGVLNGAGISNMGFGRNIYKAITNGGVNTAFGNDALANTTTGGYNVAIGSGAFRNNTSGNTGVAVGTNALAANTSGDSNIGIGNNALFKNTTGSSNIAIGFQATQMIENGKSNIVMGNFAMNSALSGSANIVIGNNASLNSSGSNNVVIGDYANSTSKSGDNNIIIGQNAGYRLADGSKNNVLIGASPYSTTPLNGYVAIGSAFISDGNGHAAAGYVPTKSSFTVYGGIATNVQGKVSGDLQDYQSTVLIKDYVTLPEPSEDNAGRIYYLINDSGSSSVGVSGTFYKNSYSTNDYKSISNRMTVQCYYDRNNLYNGWIILNEQ